MNVWVLASLLAVHNIWWNRARVDGIKAGYSFWTSWFWGFWAGAILVGVELVVAAFLMWCWRLFGG